MRVLSTIVVSVFLISCGGEKGAIACTGQYVYGITVNLNDSITGEPVSTCDVSYSIIEENYIENDQFVEGMPCESQTYIVGAGERVGVYDIHISKSGYEVWESSGVIVNASTCSVEPVVLEAFLVPQS